MKILALLLATAALSFASCASAPKKTSQCCASSHSTKACSAHDANCAHNPNCAAPHKKHKAH